MPENVHQLVAGKRQGTEPLSDAEVEKGFKGWYASKHLPHFDAPDTQQFITYRLADAMPSARRSEWEVFLHLEDKLEKQRKIEDYIDRGYGDCSLRDPRIAQIVQDNLWHHDDVKYRLLAWCIMPNHVHTLIELVQTPLGEILKSWKSYTAKQANRLMHRAGMFWEEDYFDHYIRDEEHFRQVARYIEANPVKARLVRTQEEWAWSSARYRSKQDLSARTLTRPSASRQPPPPE